MNVSVIHYRPGLDTSRLELETVVAIDVLRATTTIICALAHGASEVLPVATVAECLSIRDAFPDDPPLLAGEVENARIPGFDLGNSPLECDAARVSGKRIVLRTTNGTQVLTAFAGASHLLCAAFVNLDAVINALASLRPESVTLVCAGQDGTFSLEDFLCAGAIAAASAQLPDARLDDAAQAATLAYAACKDRLYEAVRNGTHAQDLIAQGHAADVEFATKVDLYDLVPTLTAAHSLSC